MPPDPALSLSRQSARRWEVRFLGDPDYGRDEWGDRYVHLNGVRIEAPDASTAARKALAGWRQADPFWKKEGFYGEGTIIGVQEVIEPPPIKTFVVEKGRPKLERTRA